jgi:hypothetical protein
MTVIFCLRMKVPEVVRYSAKVKGDIPSSLCLGKSIPAFFSKSTDAFAWSSFLFKIEY